jgi:hypothetical protein
MDVGRRVCIQHVVDAPHDCYHLSVAVPCGGLFSGWHQNLKNNFIEGKKAVYLESSFTTV